MTIKEIINICNGELFSGTEELEMKNFSRDTRTISSGDIYVGIKGESFNGNEFYQDAFNSGAIACLLDKDYENKLDKGNNKTIILVEDTIKAVQDLADYKLKNANIPVIAITGSVGKTSTKDMIYSVVSKKYNVLKTKGNFNNLIGLPFTVLELKDENAIVLEMGMNHLNEISTLSKIAKPDIAVITNVTSSHIGLLGSQENILKAKLEIIDGLKPNGVLIYNNDNEYLHNSDIKVNKYTYGIHNQSDLMATNIEFTDKAKFNIVDNAGHGGTDPGTFEIKVNTESFILNSLAAIAVGIKLDIPFNDINDALKDFELTGGRLEDETLKNGIRLINDAYNASLDSIKNAIDYLLNIKDRRHVAIIGDIFELGDYSQSIHKQVGEFIAKSKVNYLIAIGNDARYIFERAMECGMNPAYIKYFPDKESSYDYLKSFLKPNDAVIVKASNGMKFNEIVNKIREI